MILINGSWLENFIIRYPVFTLIQTSLVAYRALVGDNVEFVQAISISVICMTMFELSVYTNMRARALLFL